MYHWQIMWKTLIRLFENNCFSAQHKSLQSTELYINIEQAIFQVTNDEYHVKVAHNPKEACALVEAGFEYVTDMEDAKIFRKRK
jgi:hypothetical protein